MRNAFALVALLATRAFAQEAPPAEPAPAEPAPTEPAPTTPAPTTPAPTTPAPTTPTTSAPKADDGPTITDEEEGPPKLSLPTEEDRQAWQRPGFRLSLGFTYGEFHGLRGAPDGRLLGPILRLGVRLDADWSLMSTFMYAQAYRSTSTGLDGLRFSGTIDPTWHITPSLSLAFGFGFGGIVEGSLARSMDATPAPDTLQSSYTFPDASTPISSCSGVGASTLVRGEFATVMGPRSQFHVSLEVMGQWTGCVQDTGNLEPDTGQAIERRQWWPHVGGTLTAGFTWR